MKQQLLGLSFAVSMLLCASAAFAGSGTGKVTTTPTPIAGAFTQQANYQTPTWPQPTAADINGNSITALATSANSSNNYITQPLTLTYGTSGSSLATVDFWTTGDTSPTGDGPLQILQSGTAILSGAASGNTQTVALAVRYAPCGTRTSTALVSGTPFNIPSNNSLKTACDSQHAAIAYTFTPPSTAPLKADTYSLPSNFALTVQQGL